MSDIDSYSIEDVEEVNGKVVVVDSLDMCCICDSVADATFIVNEKSLCHSCIKQAILDFLQDFGLIKK